MVIYGQIENNTYQMVEYNHDTLFLKFYVVWSTNNEGSEDYWF